MYIFTRWVSESTQASIQWLRIARLNNDFIVKVIIRLYLFSPSLLYNKFSGIDFSHSSLIRNFALYWMAYSLDLTNFLPVHYKYRVPQKVTVCSKPFGIKCLKERA